MHLKLVAAPLDVPLRQSVALMRNHPWWRFSFPKEACHEAEFFCAVQLKSRGSLESGGGTPGSEALFSAQECAEYPSLPRRPALCWKLPGS